jgi:hypothetical protein
MTLPRFLPALAAILIVTAPVEAGTAGQNLLLLSGGFEPAVYTNFTQASLPSSLYIYNSASFRTITDATGNITYAPNNLVLNSDDATQWTASGTSVGASTTFSNGIKAFPVSNTPNVLSYIVARTAALSYRTIYLQSIYAQAVSGTGILAAEYNTGSGSGTVNFNLNTGVATGSGASMTSLGGGLWLCQYLMTTAATGTPYGSVYYIGAYGSTPTPTTILVGGARVSAVTYETSPRPGDQVVTTGAAYFGPAFDYDPVTNAPLGLRIEESRTNLFLNSGAPATQTITVANGSTYTVSFYGTGTLTLSGAATQTMTGSAYPARTTYTFTASSTSLTGTVTSLGTMTYPQVELGTFATSAIPTGSTSATRAADVVILQGPALTAVQRSAGAAIAETINVSGNPSNATILGNSLGYQQIQLASITTPGSYNGFNAFNGNSFAGSYATGVIRSGLSWTITNRTLSASGSIPLSNTGSANFGASALIGSDGGGHYLDGHITKLAIYNIALTPLQLHARTVLGAPF